MQVLQLGQKFEQVVQLGRLELIHAQIKTFEGAKFDQSGT